MSDSSARLITVESDERLCYPRRADSGSGSSIPRYDGAIVRASSRSRIPVELWTNIFEIVIQDIPDKKTQVQAPWILSNVCHEWRLIALGTPSLWAVVFIDSREAVSRSKDFFTHAASRLQLQLERSRERPLEIIIRHIHHDSQAPGAEVLWSALLAHIHRSWSLDVRETLLEAQIIPGLEPAVPKSTFTQSMSSAIPPAAGARYLFLREVRWSCAYWPLYTTVPLPSFMNAPYLRSMDLDFGLTSIASISGCIPFSQLVEVSFCNVGADWSVILPLLITVETLSFHSVLSGAMTGLRHRCILPSLKSLSIDVDSFHIPLFGKFDPVQTIYSTPNLENLVLNIQRAARPGEWRYQAIGKLLERSSCDLTSFTVRDIHDPYDVNEFVTHALSLMPSITQFNVELSEICSKNCMNVLIHALSETGAAVGQQPPPILCRSLRSFRITSSRIVQQLDLDALTRLAEVRHPFGLEEVEVRNVVLYQKGSLLGEIRERMKMQFGVRFIYN